MVDYVNDDDDERELGSDSRLLFTAPTEDDYLARVSDSRNFQGEEFAYRLTLREAEAGLSGRRSMGPTRRFRRGAEPPLP